MINLNNNESSRLNIMQRKQSRLGRCTNSVDEIIAKFEYYTSGTFAMTYSNIEGYLLKEIENKTMLSMTKRHLRYFRIAYSTGKLSVKECKTQVKMRTFPMKDILSVKVIRKKDSATDKQERVIYD